MKRRQELGIWLFKIEKNGIPNKKIFQICWTDVIKILQKKIEANESWEAIETYIQKNFDKFNTRHKMAGPDTMSKIFASIRQKVWSINRMATKEVGK